MNWLAFSMISYSWTSTNQVDDVAGEKMQRDETEDAVEADHEKAGAQPHVDTFRFSRPIVLSAIRAMAMPMLSNGHMKNILMRMPAVKAATHDVPRRCSRFGA